MNIFIVCMSQSGVSILGTGLHKLVTKIPHRNCSCKCAPVGGMTLLRGHVPLLGR